MIFSIILIMDVPNIYLFLSPFRRLRTCVCVCVSVCETYPFALLHLLCTSIITIPSWPHHRTHHLRTILTTQHLQYTPPLYDFHHTSSSLHTIAHTTSVRFSPLIISITHHLHTILTTHHLHYAPSHTPPPYDSHHTSSPSHTTFTSSRLTSSHLTHHTSSVVHIRRHSKMAP